MWTPNKTSIRRLIDKLGDDLDDWVRRRVKIGEVIVNVRGEDKPSIRVLQVLPPVEADDDDEPEDEEEVA